MLHQISFVGDEHTNGSDAHGSTGKRGRPKTRHEVPSNQRIRRNTRLSATQKHKLPRDVPVRGKGTGNPRPTIAILNEPTEAPLANSREGQP